MTNAAALAGARRWLRAALFAVALVAGALLAMWLYRWASQPSPPARGYVRVGTVEGVTFWTRAEGDRRVSVRTTGGRAACDANGPAEYTGILICNDAGPGGAVVAGIVPDGTSDARVAGYRLRILRAGGHHDLAVAVFAPGQEIPQGPLVARGIAPQRP